jgi:hypothetical protein
MPQPTGQPKIYHIVHIDRLVSIVADGCLWSDAEVVRRRQGGTTIGMGGIKARRLGLPVECHPGTTSAISCPSTSARGRSCST